MTMLGLLLTLSSLLPAMPDGQGTAEPQLTEIEQLEARIEAARQTILDSTVGLRFRRGHATGVIVSEAGHILTVAHAMPEPGTRVTVVLSDGRELDSIARGRNEQSDFGLLEIVEKDEAWTWSEMAPENSLRYGQPCVATGFPVWIAKSRGPVFRFGIVASWNTNWLRSSCTIMPGDSGGPIFDLEGRVIGISSWIERPLDANYAVPVQRYRDAWLRLLADEVWDRDSSRGADRGTTPYGSEVTALGLILADERGPARVAQIVTDSPAARAGLLPGDVVLAVGSTRVNSGRRLARQLERVRDHVLVALTLQRQGAEFQLALERNSEGPFPIDGEFTLLETAESLADKVRPATVTLSSRSGRQLRRVQGVMVDPRGFILTKASELRETPVATLHDGRKLDATVVGVDDATDLALLKIEGDNFETVQWDSSHEFRRGQWLVSATAGPGQSSNGIVSALAARVRGSRRAYLGIRMENASGGGALIQTVEPGTAAQRAGLRDRDVIQRFNEARIDTYFDLQGLLRRARPGQAVALRVLRDEQEVELKATLGRRPPRTSSRSGRHVADSVALSLRRSDFPSAVRHDANVAPSGCGSLLLDSNGLAIGLNIARLDRTGTLALPASEVLRVIEELVPEEAPLSGQQN